MMVLNIGLKQRCQRRINGRYRVNVGGATAVIVTFTVIVSMPP